MPLSGPDDVRVWAKSPNTAAAVAEREADALRTTLWRAARRCMGRVEALYGRQSDLCVRMEW